MNTNWLFLFTLFFVETQKKVRYFYINKDLLIDYFIDITVTAHDQIGDCMENKKIFILLTPHRTK